MIFDLFYFLSEMADYISFGKHIVLKTGGSWDLYSNILYLEWDEYPHQNIHAKLCIPFWYLWVLSVNFMQNGFPENNGHEK